MVDDDVSLHQVAELVPGGAKMKVTNENKCQYLDALAQYRLANSVKDEMEAFLKGLNGLIPDNLLSIFDENELEVRLIYYSVFGLFNGCSSDIHLARGVHPLKLR